MNIENVDFEELAAFLYDKYNTASAADYCDVIIEHVGCKRTEAWKIFNVLVDLDILLMEKQRGMNGFSSSSPVRIRHPNQYLTDH